MGDDCLDPQPEPCGKCVVCQLNQNVNCKDATIGQLREECRFLHKEVDGLRLVVERVIEARRRIKTDGLSLYALRFVIALDAALVAEIGGD